MRDHADLHLHSYWSDGINSPQELVASACKLQLGGIALTDHDTLAGLKEFMAAKVSEHLLRVPGIEISTETTYGEGHLIGYFVPLHASKLEHRLKWFRGKRRDRFPKMVKRLENIGIVLDPKLVKKVLHEIDVPGRPHLARLLVKEGIVKNIDEAFELYLGKGRPAYVKRELIPIEEGIELLRDVGAVPVLAHPFTLKIEDVKEFIKDLKKIGLLGIETEYDYSTIETKTKPYDLKAFAKSQGLITTGGSDYHGDGSRNSIGSVTVSVKVIHELRAAADSEGL